MFEIEPHTDDHSLGWKQRQTVFPESRVSQNVGPGQRIEPGTVFLDRSGKRQLTGLDPTGLPLLQVDSD